MDNRINELAKKLVNYSIRAKGGDKVMIEVTGIEAYPLVEEIIKECYAVQASPFYLIHDDLIMRSQLMHATKEQFELEAKYQAAKMKDMDCYIGIRASSNVLEFSDVPSERFGIYTSTVRKDVHGEIRIPKTRWVVLRYPNPTFAQSAKMSSREFEDFYFQTCLLDYSKMSKKMDALVNLMEKTDRVHIKGNKTDLKFSIKGIPAVKCDGRLNIPDGEIFTAPVRDSVNGTLYINTPTKQEGIFFNGITFEFKNGKIIREECEVGDPKRLTEILNRDEGARYIGEFAFGLNPYIKKEMLDTLFDEKIAGSFHFTPGEAYQEANNGNKSMIHWDLVIKQSLEDGGGEIWFDDVLIRKDGKFLLDELKPLDLK